MKQTMQVVLVVLLGVITMTGCSSDKESISVNTINYSETIFENNNQFELSYDFQYLSDYSDKDVLKKIQTSMSRSFFGEEYLKDNPQATAKNYTESMINNFKSDIAEFQNESMDEYLWNWFWTISSEISTIEDVILVYQIQTTYYTGGAHGMGAETYTNFDLRTGKELSIDDLFTPEGKDFLLEKICEEILKEHGASDWDSLLDNSCYLNRDEMMIAENFILSKTDIIFHYNAYEISCYAQGATRVTLPIKDLVGFKSDVFKK